MNKRRLLKLAGLLEADAKNKKGIKFDLNTWASPADRRKNFVGGKPTLDCNTSACAMGLACLSGAFRSAGLVFEIRPPNEMIKAHYLMPQINGSEGFGFDVPADLFEIEYDAARWLFSPEEYPRKFRKGADGERFVAKRIRDFVAGKAAPRT